VRLVLLRVRRRVLRRHRVRVRGELLRVGLQRRRLRRVRRRWLLLLLMLLLMVMRIAWWLLLLLRVAWLR
jgi:hypothetical protein